METRTIQGLQDFLNVHSRMRIVPIETNRIVLQGHYKLNAQYQDSANIEDIFHLQITISYQFPKTIPVVYELDGKIPRESKYHVFEAGNLCMGTPLRLKMILAEEPSLLTFSEKILTPYLYSFRHKAKYGQYPYGELPHNAPGLIEDYKTLFNVHDEAGVVTALQALSKSSRDANKLPCPCCYHQQLRKCEYRFFLNRFRNVIKRREAKESLQRILREK